jgi:hypothetical protein
MICESLDDFKNYELQHTIFCACDAGEYDDIISKPVDVYRKYSFSI